MAALIRLIAGRLAAMRGRMPSGLGVSRSDALFEARRGPWDYMPLRSPPRRPKLRVIDGGRQAPRPAGCLGC